MTGYLWRFVAFIVTRACIARWLIERAQRTPYTQILGPDGTLYMGRWWLFNPYTSGDDEAENKRWPSLPSIRVHHILTADGDRHLHDHPWNARTIVLRGWYAETRPGQRPGSRQFFLRARGYTGQLRFGEYHRITTVPVSGVWTLFFTWRKQGVWGFDVDGAKVPYRDYLGTEQ